MNLHATISILLFCSANLLGQSPQLDSLKALFFASENDSIRRALTGEIATKFEFIQKDSALAWAKRGHAIAENLDNPEILGQSYYQLGAAEFDKNNQPAAMEHFLKAMELFKRVDNERMVVDTEFEIGLIYQQMEDFANAKQYLDRFYNYYLKQEEPNSIIFALNQYNVLYEKMGKPDSMLFYAKETLKAAQRYGQTKYLANIHNNLAGTYLYNQDYNKAKYHFRQANEYGFGSDVSGHYFNFYAQADMYRSLGQLDSSVIFAKQALEIANSLGDLGRAAEMHSFLARLHAQKNDYRQAHEQLHQFITLKDSLTTLRHQENISALSIEYETQKKEAQIVQQQLQLEREANRRNVILFGSLAALLLAGGIFLFFQNRQRTRQRQAELELQLQATEAERLRELDQLKSNFFANISHEFRTPLALILSPLREMYNDTFRGNVKEYQKVMIRNGERLLGLVNQLLDLARLESGRMQLDTQAADLTKFVRSVVFSFESWAMRKQLFFQTNFPKQPIIAHFDSDKLEKIIANLLSNAFKFTPEKGRVTFDLIVLDKQEDKIDLQIKVQDTGAGIPPGQLPHIFDRFYSQPSEDQEMKGSGIGLALTKDLVELHGGTIEVESELHKGTVFTIQLPFQLAKTATTELAAPPMLDNFFEENAISKTSPLNNLKPIVLIAEDNPDLRTYMKDQLHPNYQSVEASNGQQGLDLATEIIPDLVLTDVMMPEMDGMTLCQTLKTDERTSHIPVVIITARSDQQDKLSGLSTGADAYLTKPFDPKELQIVVKNLIEQRRKLREKFAEGFIRKAPQLDFVSPAENAFLQKITKIVEDKLDDENFSIEELGKTVGMSRSQLHRKIKAITDQSPSVFVRTLRLQHAYHLLKQKAGNISEVAFQVGIPNLAYFSRSFSEQYGFPPSTLLHGDP